MSAKSNAQLKIDTARAYRSLMLNDNGELKPEAEAVLRDLEKQCGWMVDTAPTDGNGAVDTHKMAGMWFKRQTYAHIKMRLFGPLEPLIKVIEKESQ